MNDCLSDSDVSRSGTNLVAAQLLGMDYYGFEIDPATCRIARERLTQRPLDLGDFLEVPA
ncbi:MAG: hypothetical protein WC382_11790 [Methanoregulaceae archaeon]